MTNDKHRPTDWMENSYIGKDGKDYHTYEALQSADAEFRRVMTPSETLKLTSRGELPYCLVEPRAIVSFPQKSSLREIM